jgi:hypothetical protein
LPIRYVICIFINKQVDIYSLAKLQLFMIQVCIRKLAKFKDMPRPNSHDMEKLCEKIRLALSDNNQLDALLRLFTKVIDEVVEGMNVHHKLSTNEIVRRKEFTTLLENKCQSIKL